MTQVKDKQLEKNKKPSKEKKSLLTLGSGKRTMEVSFDTTNITFPILNEYGAEAEYELEIIADKMQNQEFLVLECGSMIKKNVAVALAKKILELAKKQNHNKD